MITYIIKTKTGEYYCGFTVQPFLKRWQQHIYERYPSWFAIKPKRKSMAAFIIFKGDCEDMIKHIGSKRVFLLCSRLKGGSMNAVGAIKDAMMARAPVRRLVGIGAVQLPAIQNTEPGP